MEIGVNLLPRPGKFSVLEKSLRDLCPTHARIDLDRSYIERRAGVYDLAALAEVDKIVNLCMELNIVFVMTVAYTPLWDNPMGKNYPPNNIFFWQLFIQTVIDRYHPEFIAIWNEPNLTQFYNGTREDFITKIWKPAVSVIHDPIRQTTLVGPDLSHQGNWDDWLTDNRIMDDVDIVSHHCYGSAFKVRHRLSSWLPCWLYKSFKCIKKKYFNDKPVWFTEIGFKSNDGERDQKKNWEKILNRNWENIIFIFELYDDKNIVEEWGIYDAAGNPKLAAQLIKQYMV